MVADIATLLGTFTAAVTSAVSALPPLHSSLAPEDGISLHDTKNELFLSYLQHLSFLLLLKIRGLVDDLSDHSAVSQQDVVKKLVELRVYLDKGVRPLEGRLKYQIDKVVRAADEAERALKSRQSVKQPAGREDGSADGEVEGDSDDQYEIEGINEDPENDVADEPTIDELSYRPNPLAFRNAASLQGAKTEQDSKEKFSDGIYHPPRISATVMPDDRPAKKERQNVQKSSTIDDFIATEMSTAPMAEPSIGSTITHGGRYIKSARDRAADEERREYEETNLVRLPKVGKKEAAAQRRREGRMGYGGEEWSALGAGAERIMQATKGRKGGALERSRKRGREIVDGGRGDGRGGFEGGFERKKRMFFKKSSR